MPKRKSRSIRATDEEWTEIKRRAEEAGMKRSEYMRKAALGKLSSLDSAVLHHELRTLVADLYRIRKRDEDADERKPQSLRRVLSKAERLLDDLRETGRAEENS